MKQQALANLRDLHLPDPIGLWPLAPAWYVIIIVALLAIFTAVYAFIRFHNKNKIRKVVLGALNEIERAYLLHGNAEKSVYELTLLIKRYYFLYLPREKVAPLYAEQWLTFLNHQNWAKRLSQLSYQKHPKEDLTTLFSEIRIGIKKNKLYISKQEISDV